MTIKPKKDGIKPNPLTKTATGIEGLDEITFGGLPSERCTLLCGGAGCGKTILALEFLIRGATLYNEPGVMVVFEETAEEISQNAASLGFDLQDLIRRKLIHIDFVEVNKNEIDETGEYDLEGLFIRLGYSIDKIKAKRVVIDTIETLFGGLDNQGILRAELKRLFRWLKEKNVTSIITAERGDGTLTRNGLEEYVSDCVILLDHRSINQITTRRIKVVKYRGSEHGTNEYPFLINKQGVSILPITSLKLEHTVSDEIIATGIDELNAMFGPGGFYKGSSVLISGTSGTAKTILASHIISQACQNNQKALYFAFEESPEQLIRNINSVGINLGDYVKNGLLEIHSSRPSLYGLEMHLLAIHNAVRNFNPDLVVIDPMTDLIISGMQNEGTAMLTRLIDMLKVNQVTAVFTSLSQYTKTNVVSPLAEGVSSLIDTWIHLRDIEGEGETNRGLFIVKSRGMAHSNKIMEFVVTDKGIKLMKPVSGKPADRGAII